MVLFLGEYTLRQSKHAQLLNQLPQAKAYAEDAANLVQGNWRMTYQLGAVAEQNKQVDEALAFYEKAVTQNPNDIPSLNAIARLSFETGRNWILVKPATPESAEKALRYLAKAQDFADKVLQICPVLPETEAILGYCATLKAIQQQAVGTDKETLYPLWQEAADCLTRALSHGRDQSK